MFGGQAFDIGGICTKDRGYEVSSVYGSFPYPLEHTSDDNWDIVVFAQALGEYLEGRQSLRGLVLLMDCRHPLTDLDHQMLTWAAHTGLPVHILLTKADKLKPGPAKRVLEDVCRQVPELHPEASVQLFSARKNAGVDEVRAVLIDWLNHDETAH